MQLVHNAQRTVARRTALQAYYAHNVLRDEQFICPHCAACKQSHRASAAAGHFVEAQLNALGSCYDLTVDDVPFRVVIIGQETGTPHAHISLQQRMENLHRAAHEQRFKAEGEHSARSQHLKGVTSALRLLFDRGLGVAHEDEFITLADGSRHHLFECFALVNYLLCSAVSNMRSKRGESTAVMRRNCGAHFRATLEILQPTVIIAQGKAFWPSVRRAFDRVDSVDDHLYRARLGDHEALVASFAHPSAMHPHNWGSNERMPYLLETVAPTIARLRELVFERR